MSRDDHTPDHGPAPRDIVPPTRRRLTRAEVVAAIEAGGRVVHIHAPRLIEDPDGRPVGVATVTSAAVLARPTPRLLGWTPDEWADPEVVE